MDRIAVYRYATALFELAIERGLAKEYDKAATDISTVLTSDKDLLGVINHLSIPPHEKMDTMKGIFSGKIPEDFMGIFQLVFRRGRQGELLGILERINELYKDYIKVGVAKLYSATELPKNKLNEIKELLQKKLDKTIEFELHVDPALIAGFRVEIDGLVFDSSMKSQVAALKKELLGTL
ncbi:MAG: ATP synthase F1 subunit delta [Defluviitaleaceae bacterium]|nr:ATP synthase F1 subunit delta [Defluviitaleaceae bacterium]